jgi:hypothetical protein
MITFGKKRFFFAFLIRYVIGPSYRIYQNRHEFQGSKTDSGPLGPDYWWDLIYKYNTENANEEDKWNVFLHMGQHMYVKDLAKHMIHFEEHGIRHLARHYKSLAIGNEDITMFVVFVPNMFNGNTIIIHAKEVSDAKQAAKFVELEKSACTYAVALPYSLERLEMWWNNLYDHKDDAAGLPKPFPVMDTQPTFDIEEVKSYFDDKIEIHRFGAHTEMQDKSTETSTCKVFQIHLSTQFDTAYEAR